MKLESFNYNCKEVKFKEPIELTVFKTTDHHPVVQSELLNVTAPGRTMAEALDTLNYMIGSQYEFFAFCDINELSKEAIPLREKLLGLISDD